LGVAVGVGFGAALRGWCWGCCSSSGRGCRCLCSLGGGKKDVAAEQVSSRMWGANDAAECLSDKGARTRTGRACPSQPEEQGWTHRYLIVCRRAGQHGALVRAPLDARHVVSMEVEVADVAVLRGLSKGGHTQWSVGSNGSGKQWCSAAAQFLEIR